MILFFHLVYITTFATTLERKTLKSNSTMLSIPPKPHEKNVSPKYANKNVCLVWLLQWQCICVFSFNKVYWKCESKKLDVFYRSFTIFSLFFGATGSAFTVWFFNAKTFRFVGWRKMGNGNGSFEFLMIFWLHFWNCMTSPYFSYMFSNCCFRWTGF